MPLTPSRKTAPLHRFGVIGSLTFFIGIGCVGHAHAQFYPAPLQYRAPLPYHMPVGIHPAQIVEDLEARGYQFIGIAARRSDVFVVDAISPRNEPIRLIIDAFDGEILERFTRGAPMQSNGKLPNAGRIPNTGKVNEGMTSIIGALPLPPRRPNTPDMSQPRIVAPARPPSEWAPSQMVPVAPLE